MSAPRLLKIAVQPVFVAEQDGELIELPVQPVTFSAGAWRDLDPQTWAKEAAITVGKQLGESARPDTAKPGA